MRPSEEIKAEITDYEQKQEALHSECEALQEARAKLDSARADAVLSGKAKDHREEVQALTDEIDVRKYGIRSFDSVLAKLYKELTASQEQEKQAEWQRRTGEHGKAVVATLRQAVELAKSLRQLAGLRAGVPTHICYPLTPAFSGALDFTCPSSWLCSTIRERVGRELTGDEDWLRGVLWRETDLGSDPHAPPIRSVSGGVSPLSQMVVLK